MLLRGRELLQDAWSVTLYLRVAEGVELPIYLRTAELVGSVGEARAPPAAAKARSTRGLTGSAGPSFSLLSGRPPLTITPDAQLRRGGIRRRCGGGSVEGQPFKTCTFCGHVWPERTAFLADPTIVLVGYQALFADLRLGLLLFNHLVCETTLAVRAGEFVNLYHGPVFSERLKGSESCVGHCEAEGDFAPCTNQCECAWVREVLQIVRGWPKLTPDQAASVR